MQKKWSQPQCPTVFGQRLKHYRSAGGHVAGSLRQCNCQPEPRRRRTVDELVLEMNNLGCRISPANLTDIEERPVLPTDPERFFDVIVSVLDLCEHEGLDLLFALAYSILEIELGEEFANSVLPDGRTRFDLIE